jgi:hypothetical protein
LRDLSVQPEVKIMRTHQAVAVVAVILVGLVAKHYYFPTSAAVASINVSQMSLDYPDAKYLPVQAMHDMTFVFAAENPAVKEVPAPAQKMHDMTFVFSDGD